MQHSVTSYPEAQKLMIAVFTQLSENLITRVDDEFEDAITETDHKKRAKLEKQRRRELADLSPISSKMYPLQVRMIHLRTNLSFLLENAHNRTSYAALAKYFAEYDFVSKRIKQHARSIKHPALVSFLERCTVLEADFFAVMTDTLANMEKCIRTRMIQCPEQYIDLDVADDSHMDFDAVKASMKDHKEKLKKEFAQSGA